MQFFEIKLYFSAFISGCEKKIITHTYKYDHPPHSIVTVIITKIIKKNKKAVNRQETLSVPIYSFPKHNIYLRAVSFLPCQALRHAVKMFVYILLHRQRLVNINIAEFAVSMRYDAVCLIRDQKIDSHRAHRRRIHAIAA